MDLKKKQRLRNISTTNFKYIGNNLLQLIQNFKKMSQKVQCYLGISVFSVTLPKKIFKFSTNF